MSQEPYRTAKRQLARISLRSRRVAVARANERERLALDPASRAYCQGDVPMAVAELEEALRVCPGSASLHYALGLVYGRRREWARAIECLHTAANIDPGCYLTLRSLAVARLWAGDREGSLDAWHRAYAVAPDARTKEDAEAHLRVLV